MTSSTAQEKQFTVSIIGGGIGGLTLAIGLLRRNVRVQIYEAAQAFRETGLGVSIGPAAHRAMPMIDPQIREIYDSIITTHADSPGYEAFKLTWIELVWATGAKAGQAIMNFEAPPSGQTSARRCDFIDALVGLIPSDIVHYGKRLVSYEEASDGVHLSFQDGTSVVADVVIGCDGIHSKIRDSMFPDEIEHLRPRYAGTYTYRAVLDMETMVEAVGDHRARVATKYLAKRAYCVSYPIMRAKKVYVGFCVKSDTWNSESWVRPAAKDDMMRDLGFMGDEVNALLRHISEAVQIAIFELPAVSTFVKSRVALLGDAAHATTPHQGAGAGQAIEDSLVLAELLSDPSVVTTDHVAAAFHAYDFVRRPRSQRVVASSKEVSRLSYLIYDGIGDDEHKLKGALHEKHTWLWNLDLEEHVETARRKMIDMLQQGHSS